MANIRYSAWYNCYCFIKFLIPKYKNLEEKQERASLRKAIEKLPTREKNIIELRYGLGNYDELTQREVADILGISQSYISRLEKKILGKLKKEMSKYV